MRSYQIVEILAFDKILGKCIGVELQILILKWVASILKKEIVQEGLAIEVDVIKVTYVSTYAALGIYYPNPEDILVDYGKYIEQKGERILRNCSFIEFIDESYSFLAQDLISYDDKGYIRTFPENESQI
ncbi:hypothetical protein [Xanthocytophaga agilis]|uniref:Uncharacterized protein n=1 Tax=Xanthocytophaga agilis TaxID=3048010 RepID=A0AAE3UCM9_9BACT|nr:hypothetical protein [Xanthocytophaga agilis]MDJ1501043.1 hypothetical protein [Xanthocytophaga agilis]